MVLEVETLLDVLITYSDVNSVFWNKLCAGFRPETVIIEQLQIQNLEYKLSYVFADGV